MSSSSTRKAFDLLAKLPRISLDNLKRNPHSKKKPGKRGNHHNHARGGYKRTRILPLGYEMGNFPFHLRFRAQNWNEDARIKRSYCPLPLKKLQLMIDLGRVRTDIPIDVCQLSQSGFLGILDPMENEFGYLVQDEGMDVFKAEVNLEVQWATEQVIAAIERTGSVITTAYYDTYSLLALKDPIAYFEKGEPIKKRMLPPQSLIEYYSDPKNRGYLADPDAIAEERFILSQKYGYELPDIKKSPKYNLLIQRKDPRQIFHGLRPGWVINLKDKQILKPKDKDLIEYYTG